MNNKIILEDFSEGDGYYKVNLAYLSKEQVEEIEALVSKWKPTDEDIKSCIGMCLTDVNEQRFKDYGTNLRDCLAWLEKQAQVKETAISQHENKTCKENDDSLTCKGKPKFQEGDWLYENEPNNYARFIQILEIVDTQGKNRCKISRDLHNDEDIVEFSFIEKYYHSFSIQDVKSGDVLAFKDDSYILLVKEVHNTIYGMRVSCYCHVLIGKFETVEYQIRVDGLYPATKEQQDLLFQKMHEAGWEWDAKAKKLNKKLEAFPILSNSSKTVKDWTEEDAKAIDNCCLLIGAADECYEKAFKDNCIHYLQNLKQRLEQ